MYEMKLHQNRWTIKAGDKSGRTITFRCSLAANSHEAAILGRCMLNCQYVTVGLEVQPQ